MKNPVFIPTFAGRSRLTEVYSRNLLPVIAGEVTNEYQRDTTYSVLCLLLVTISYSLFTIFDHSNPSR